MSKKKIANSLSLSERQVHRMINTLIEKDLIEKDEDTKHLRTVDTWNECISNKDEWILGKKGESPLLSVKTESDCQNVHDSDKMSCDIVTKCHSDYDKMSYNNNNIIITNNTIKKKSIKKESLIPEHLIEPIEEFKQHRKHIKKPMSDLAVSKLIKKLYSISEVPEDHIRMLDDSIAQGWQGVFEGSLGTKGQISESQKLYVASKAMEERKEQEAIDKRMKEIEQVIKPKLKY